VEEDEDEMILMERVVEWIGFTVQGRRNKGRSNKPKADKDYKALVKAVKSQGKTISALKLVASGRIKEASSDTSSDSDGDSAGNASEAVRQSNERKRNTSTTDRFGHN
jgi:hypothetical protein